MTKFSALLILSALTTAQAMPAADCTKSLFISATSLFYQSKPQFPKASEDVDVYFNAATSPLKSFTLCNFTFMPDIKAETLSISASPFANFVKLFPKYGVPSKSIYFRVAQKGFNGGDFFVVFDPNTYKLSYETTKNYSASSYPYTIGVKVDSGVLQPFYFEGKLTPIQVSRTAKTVDIYVKSEYNNLLTDPRITLNIAKSMIQMYNEAIFPTK